ncbi:MAG: thiosulfate oxidation carrier protein SoxY [Sideroxydans sp.]|nr:thiosulfate oxidation carrier protein SoxY [Sideroxydans sp.]
MNKEIDLGRRKALSTGGIGLLALFGGASLLRPSEALAEWNKPAFTSKAVDEALSSLGATNPEENSAMIRLTVPEIAENGAVVPVGISTSLPKVEQIAIMVDKNPNVLAAVFTIPEGSAPEITTRVKMGKTAHVVALVKADGKYYQTSKEVKVTAGGCGG